MGRNAISPSVQTTAQAAYAPNVWAGTWSPSPTPMSRTASGTGHDVSRAPTYAATGSPMSTMSPPLTLTTSPK